MNVMKDLSIKLIHFYKRLKMVENARTPSSARREEIEAAEKNDATAAAEASIEASNGGVEEPAVVEVPVNKKKKAAAEALNENVVNEDGAPDVTSSEKSEAKTEADGEKKEEAKKDENKKTPKPVKRVVPTWASLSDSARTKMPKSMLQKPKIQDLVLSAFEACADSKGSVTAGSIRKYVMEENPDFNSIQIKKAVLKAVDRGLIKQVKGKGFTGSFKLESAKNVAKAERKLSQLRALNVSIQRFRASFSDFVLSTILGPAKLVNLSKTYSIGSFMMLKN